MVLEGIMFLKRKGVGDGDIILSVVVYFIIGGCVLWVRVSCSGGLLFFKRIYYYNK